MTNTLATSLLAKFSQFINDHTGLEFSQKKWPELERGARAAAKAFQFTNTEECIRWLLSSKLNQKQIETLASFLTVGETYFFRDPKMFQVLEKNILPALIYKRLTAKDKYLRIWCAGCASGEEVYSIAIVLSKLIPDLQDWNITLLANDINIEFLNKLSKGIYSEWSFRGVTDDIKSHYFTKTPQGHYKISAKLKKMVTPFYMNLSQDNYPSFMNNTNAMDIIMCRNVLMYFSPTFINKTITKFYQALVNDGIFLTGPCESLYVYLSEFKSEQIEHVKIYKKQMTEQEIIIETQTIQAPEIIIQEPQIMESEINYQLLALDFANKGNLKEALASNLKAIEQNKTNHSLHYLHGIILSELGEQEQAIAAFNRVIYLNPDYILVYIVLGNILNHAGKKREAEKCLNHAILLLNKLSPDEVVPDSEGMTAGRLITVVKAMSEVEQPS